MIIPYLDTNIEVNNEYIRLSNQPVSTEYGGKVYIYERVDCGEERKINLVMYNEAHDWKDCKTLRHFERNPNATYYAQYFIDAKDAKVQETPAIKDTVNHPYHYQTESGIEVIDVIDAFTKGLDGVVAFDIGNAIKYVCRWKNKGGTEDLRKAIWYIQHAIEHYDVEERKS